MWLNVKSNQNSQKPKITATVLNFTWRGCSIKPHPLGFQNSTDQLLIKHALTLTSLFGLLTTPCATCYVLPNINRIRGCERRIPLCRKPQLCVLFGPCLLVA